MPASSVGAMYVDAAFDTLLEKSQILLSIFCFSILDARKETTAVIDRVVTKHQFSNRIHTNLITRMVYFGFASPARFWSACSAHGAHSAQTIRKPNAGIKLVSRLLTASDKRCLTQW